MLNFKVNLYLKWYTYNVCYLNKKIRNNFFLCKLFSKHTCFTIKINKITLCLENYKFVNFTILINNS